MNIGVDIVSINRIRKIFSKYGTRFTNQFLTDAEKKKELKAQHDDDKKDVKEQDEKDKEELKAQDYEAWKAFVGGGYGDDVDMLAFQTTVVRGVESIIERHSGERVAVFCHGGVVNMWASHVLDMPPRLFTDVRYASVSRFLCASTGERSLVSLNETQHLTG